MKKLRKVMASAIAMMTFSTAAAVTGTVAWFTASNVVTATGMSIKADTEQGINISNESKTVWKESAEASHNGKIGENQAAFIPTSTYDGVHWYHANSEDRDSHEAFGGYTTLTYEQNGSSGVYAVTNQNLSITDKNVYLLNKFYLRSSTPFVVNAPKLYVNSIAATAATSNSTALNKSLRVLVSTTVSSTDYIKVFAPFETGNELKSYDVATNAGSYTALNQQNVELVPTALQIPAASDDTSAAALEIRVYVYFEGEDVNCKSANIPSEVLDTISLTCKFGTEILNA